MNKKTMTLEQVALLAAFLGLLLFLFIEVAGGMPKPRRQQSTVRQPVMEPAQPQPNILLVTVDDVGPDSVGYPGIHPSAPYTPVINQLAAQGLVFNQYRVMPACSPTRATWMTGLLPTEHGITQAIGRTQTDVQLSPRHTLLPKQLKAAGYETAILGKWHLSSTDSLTGPLHPVACGFDVFAGLLVLPEPTYYSWTKSVGTSSGLTYQAPELQWNTADTTDDALTLIPELSEPWFLWVSYYAPHWTPQRGQYQEPPPGTFPGPWPGPLQDWKEHRQVMTNTDYEIGRLMAGVDILTTQCWLMGDNGTERSAPNQPQFGRWPNSQSKGTCYEGGVLTPCIAWGAGVTRVGYDPLPWGAQDLGQTLCDVGSALGMPGGTSVAPALTQDLWAGGPSETVMEFRRPHFGPPWTLSRQAVTDGQYKLMRVDGVDTWHELTWPDDGPAISPVNQQALYDHFVDVLDLLP